MHTPLHTTKTLETSKKSMPCLIKNASRSVADCTSKKQCFLSFTFYKTQRSYKKIMCVYFLFHWFSGENCMFLFCLHKGRQTSKELKRNMKYCFSDVFTYHLNLKNFVSLFFLIQDNFMF